MAVIKMGNKTLFTQTGNDNPKINTNIKEEDFYEFTGTINFNSCGVNVGYYGPTLSQAITQYASESFSNIWLQNTDYFNVIAGVQLFKVPRTGTYNYTVKGSRGGDATYAGLGISLTSSSILYSGEILKIVCGQKGNYDGVQYAGAGGASFIAVFRMGVWIPLLVAGGGAGQSGNSPNSLNSNRNAFAPSTGKGDHATWGGSGSLYSTDYSGDIGVYWPGGGGGGWSSDGNRGGIGRRPPHQSIEGKCLNSNSPFGGFWYWENGVADGTGNGVTNGGFGGGGATGRSNGSAGGGGGWWGGNATFVNGTSSDDTSTLGGGSYSMNSYTNNGTNNGPGEVTFTFVS